MVGGSMSKLFSPFFQLGRTDDELGQCKHCFFGSGPGGFGGQAVPSTELSTHHHFSRPGLGRNSGTSRPGPVFLQSHQKPARPVHYSQKQIQRQVKGSTTKNQTPATMGGTAAVVFDSKRKN